MINHLVLTGGWAHDFEEQLTHLSEAVRTGLADVDQVETIAVDRLDWFASMLLSPRPDLVTVHACHFRMLDERYTDEQRAAFAQETPEELRRNLRRSISLGTPLLAMHTAAVCFDDWPEWAALMGGSWSWERSWHPTPEEMAVRLVGDHPVVAGFDAPSMQIVDERYTDLVVHESSQILAVSPDADGIEHPLLWCHESAGGRVVYDSLGHDARSLTHPGHVELIGRAVRWLVGHDDAAAVGKPER